MTFEPIAIVGQACLLPGSPTPHALWEHVLAGRDLLTASPPGRWGATPARVMAAQTKGGPWVDRAGYLTGFAELFDPEGFALHPAEILGLDQLFLWVLHTAREAWKDAGCPPTGPMGAVLGNLSLPGEGLASWAEHVWLEAGDPELARRLLPGDRPAARNRFMSGLPAHLLARALRLGGGAFSLDAACASSLYAIKLACDRLHDRTAETMLAGAVNRADPLFLNIGFSALQALSPTGRSRPFHREADGLVPTEGAAFVVLKRLTDAQAAGDRVLGVIRGIGLSNDGRGQGLLVPSSEGQIRALLAAYDMAGLDPGEVSLIECHATGTPIGDATELQSMRQAFGSSPELPIGSLKSNLGHSITVAGLAGLIKVLGAMEAGRRPASLHAGEAPLEALAGSNLRLLTSSEPWNGVRRAGISAFGFGGNNAHLIVEQYSAKTLHRLSSPPGTRSDVAIVGLGVFADGAANRSDLAADLFGQARPVPVQDLELDVRGLRFPPKDLEQALPQQAAILKVALEAMEGVALPQRDRAAVYVGMQCDATIGRHGTRARLPERAEAAGLPAAWIASACEAIAPPLTAAATLGSLPNIVANRLNAQFDMAGPSFSVSAEEISGLVALRLATRALQAGEIDLALVGAVDLCAERAHAEAVRELLGDEARPADAAVALVVKRLEDAERAGDAILAVIPDGDDAPCDLALGTLPDAERLDRGDSHAACGLLYLAAAALACHHRALPRTRTRQRSIPWIRGTGSVGAAVSIDALGEQSCRQAIRSVRGHSRGFVPANAPRIHVYSGRDRGDLLAAVAQGRESDTGPARLAIVASTEAEKAERLQRFERSLAEGRPAGEGVFWYERPVAGELACVFGGAASAYLEMGRTLAMAGPDLVEGVARRFGALEEATAWIHADPPGLPIAPLDKLWGAAFVSLLHVELTASLGLRADAAIGLSSGETLSLIAMGAWSDLDGFHRAFSDSGAFTRDLGGQGRVLRRAWGLESVRWVTYRVLAPEAAVRAALEREPHAHLLIWHAPDDCAIGGEAGAVERVIASLDGGHAARIDYDIAAHCPEVGLYADDWRRLHSWPTRAVPDVRFYTHATGTHYVPSTESVAEALTIQAIQTIDLPRLVENAYADGVRIFVEHGPQGAVSGWIGRILGDRPHLAVSLDARSDPSLFPVASGIARLIAAGVGLDWRGYNARFSPPTRADRSGPVLRLPLHADPVALPVLAAEGLASRPAAVLVMEPAPPLEAVLATWRAQPESAGVPPACEPEAGATVDSPGIWGWQVEIQERFLAVMQRQAAIHRAFLEASTRAFEQAIGVRALAGGDSLAVPAAEAPAIPQALPVAPSRPTGPTFDRSQLEQLASGEISAVLGPLFRSQDAYRRQVRMPEPPLLLAERVTGLEAEPGVLGPGTIRTETDIRWDSWYLHQGRIPPGILIESGQADLLLASWMGVDFENRSERVYRLLGCELTYHGSLPRAGDTLAFDIHIDRHIRQGDVRLFLFHYDCRVDGERCLSVRQGQAGFFTDRELAESGGVLWSAEATRPDDPGPIAAARVPEVGDRFDRDQVRAFSEGRIVDCFGPHFALAGTHTRTPRIPSGRLCLMGEVTHLDRAGGPWGLGYMRSVLPIGPEDWFFEGHFKNDPCMPGTLMIEGGMQAMAFYLTAMGFTLDKDGWRFEPVPEIPCEVRCRGQAIPSSRELVFEVFVEALIADPLPTLFAHLLITVDGLKACHARRIGLRLVPDHPLSSDASWPSQLQAGPVADHDGFRFDHASLLACALGRPSAAFGPAFSVFDGTRRLPRLPGPPYHFMSRIARIDGAFGVPRVGSTLDAVYEIPSDAWYFRDNGHATMPFCVLMEAALQPCGWLASFIGIPLRSAEDLFFRNLDGTGTLLAEIRPDSGELLTRVTLTGVAHSAGMAIVSFDVACHVGAAEIYRMQTTFGFFPAKALENQVGLAASPEEEAWLFEPDAFKVNLTERPARYFHGSLRLCAPSLLMLDRVTGYWPGAGKAGLGRMRAEKDVEPSEWFFKAHFFQDPVQPGSLGIEAMLQLLQFYMLETEMAAGIENPRFEPIALDRAVTWKYRGQVVPRHRLIVTELEILSVGVDERGPYALAEAWLWVDGMRIYHARNLAMRIVSGDPSQAGDLEVLDPEVQTWLADHCPTYVIPAVPMAVIADRIAAAAQAAAPGERVVAIEDLRLSTWLSCKDGPVRFRTEVFRTSADLVGVRLQVRQDDRERPAAVARVRLASSWPPAPVPLAAMPDAREAGDPYTSGSLFHGPAFQVMRRWELSATGASAILDAKCDRVPIGLLHPALVDGAVQAIPHDALETLLGPSWAGLVSYPTQLTALRLYGPPPATGLVRVEARLEQADADKRLVRFFVQLAGEAGVWAEMDLVLAAFPKGPLGRAAPGDRRDFLLGRRHVPGLGLSRAEDGESRLSLREVLESDWLPGTVARVYGVEGGDGRGQALTRQVLARDHVGRLAGVHPARVRLSADDEATADALPLNRYVMRWRQEGEDIVVGAESRLDLGPVRTYWRSHLGVGEWLGEALALALMERFMDRFLLADPADFAALRGRPVLYLMNHQVGVESFLFSLAAGALSELPVAVVAKSEHRASWLGRFISALFSYPGIADPSLLVFFDRQEPQALHAILRGERGKLSGAERSLAVHVQGTRSVSCRQKVDQVSAAFLDLALEARLPVVPVRFVGGLPVEPASERLEFPWRFGRQDYHLGRSISPEELSALALRERKQRILDAINDLGTPSESERPKPPDRDFERAVQAKVAQTGLSEPLCVLRLLLDALQDLAAASDLAALASDSSPRARPQEDDWTANLIRFLDGL